METSTVNKKIYQSQNTFQPTPMETSTINKTLQSRNFPGKHEVRLPSPPLANASPKGCNINIEPEEFFIDECCSSFRAI